MEARLAGRRETGGGSPDAGKENADLAEAVAGVYDRRENVVRTEDGVHRPPLQESEGAPNAWPDESAEAAMLSELRARGEKISPEVRGSTAPVEEIDPKNLPPLDELVKRLPPEVRETLDDLFRVKFVRVTRVPQSALKE